MRSTIIILSGWRFLSAFLRKKFSLGVFSRADPELSSYPFWLKLKMLSHPYGSYIHEYFQNFPEFISIPPYFKKDPPHYKNTAPIFKSTTCQTPSISAYNLVL